MLHNSVPNPKQGIALLSAQDRNRQRYIAMLHKYVSNPKQDIALFECTGTQQTLHSNIIKAVHEHALGFHVSQMASHLN